MPFLTAFMRQLLSALDAWPDDDSRESQSAESNMAPSSFRAQSESFPDSSTFCPSPPPADMES